MAEQARTMVYTVEQDGKVFDVEGPEGATPEQLQAFIASSGSEGSPAEAAAEPMAPAVPDQREWGFSSEAREAANTPTGSDEYVAEVNRGIADGSIATADDLVRVANGYGFSFPDRAAVDGVFEQLKKGARFGGTSPAEYGVDISDARGTGGLGEDADALARGVAGSFGLDDEIDALRRTAFEDGSYGENLARARAIREYDEENNYGARLTGEILGGLIVPAGIEAAGLGATVRAAAASAGRNALRSGATMAEARAIAARAATQKMAQDGAIYGGVAGAGRADGELTDRLAGGAGGVLVGAGAGAALGAAGQALAPRSAAAAAAARAEPLTDAQRVAGAASRQGVDVLPADVAGPTTRRLTAAAAQAPLSAAPVINQGQKALGQAEGVRNRVAASIGRALNPEAAGEAAIAGAETFIRRTSSRGGALYDAAEQASNGVTVTPNEALTVLNRNISELRDTPGGATGLSTLESLRDELQQRAFSVAGVRRMRTTLRDDFLSEGLRGSDLERRVGQVIDAAADDVTASLRSAGRSEAAKRFATADRYWRNRIRTIDDAIAPIIGKEGDASGELVTARLQAAAKGNNRRFTQFLNALPEAEQADVRATLVSRLGRSTKGAQNDAGDAFSLQTFLSHWDDLGETAKVRLFGKEGRAALNDLATIASGARETANYANRSNTAGGIWGNIGALFGVGSISPVAAISSLVVQYGGGRLLASPRFARWVARPPASREGLPGYAARLTRIARAEPAIANDVLALQSRLQQAFGGSPARLAAEESGQGAGVAQRRDRQPGNQQQERQP